MQRGRSGGRGGFGRGDAVRGAGGNVGGVNAQAAQELLWSLLSGAMGGPQRGRSSQPRSSAGSQRRAGEWPCPCGFATNRPHRLACYACGRERDGAGAARKGSSTKGGGKGGSSHAADLGRPANRGAARRYDGPIGADGARPLLGRPGATWNSDYGQTGGAAAASSGGNSIAAGAPRGAGLGPVQGKGSAMSLGKGPSRTDLGGGGGASSTTPQAVMEEGGFTMVQRRRAKGKGGSQACQTVDDSAPAAAPPYSIPVRPRWADEQSECDQDDCMEHEHEEDDVDWVDGQDEDVEATAGDDPRLLRANFEDLAKAVRSLERKGGFTQDGTALRALREARDKAEATWRAAKAPAPLPTRLAWAEAKLERAAAALSRARFAVEELDEQYDRQRAALCQKVEQADAWHKWRQQQVDDLHNEVADKAPGRRKEHACEGGMEVRDKIRCHLLPELQSIMEHVEGNPEILDKLSLLAAGLVDAETRLGDRPTDATAQTFDIADGDSEGGNGRDTAQAAMGKGGASSTQACGKADHGGGKGKTAEWRAEGPGRWTRAATASGASEATTRSVQQSTSTETPPHVGEGPRAGGLVDAERGAAGAGDQGLASGSGDAQADTDEEQGKPPRHRRRRIDEDAMAEAREASDRKRAEQLHAQQAAAAAAQIESFNAGAGGFGSEAALSLAAQKFVVEVQTAQRRAARQGVEPKADDGRTLLQLAPMELQKWVEAKLGEDDEY